MQLTIERAKLILDTYTLQDLLELNDYSEEEALCFLYQHRQIRLPETLPIDLDHDTSY